MEIQEAKHYLSVLIELDLYPTLRALTEGNFSQEQLNNKQQKMIINFINRLPEDYRKIPNRDEIIVKTLERMGMQTIWGQKKMEEISVLKRRKKDMREKPSKSNSTNIREEEK